MKSQTKLPVPLVVALGFVALMVVLASWHFALWLAIQYAKWRGWL
jgi:hypothetical protein